MVDKKVYAIGALVLVVLATAIYISLPGQVKMRVDNDKTTFYVLNENNRWEVSGREYNSLWDFPSKMNRDLSTVRIWEEHPDPEVYIYRNTGYIRGPVIIDKYSYSGELTDVELFPIDHEIRILNGEGYVYQYEVRDLEYFGETKDLIGTTIEFGKNMKVEVDEGYYWAKVYKSGILKVRYKITSDNFIVHARLFDPTTLYLNGSSANVTVEVGEEVNITAIGIGQICLSGDHPDMGTNFTCGTNIIEFLWNATGGILNFNDSTTEKNYSFTASGCSDNYLNSIRNNSDVLRSFLDISGYNTSNHFPKDIKLDIDADGTNDTVTSGELRGTDTYLYWFNDSTTSKVIYYNGSATQIVYVKLPQGLNVSGASINITPSVNDWQSHDSMFPRVLPTQSTRGTMARQRAPAANLDRMWHFGGKAYNLDGVPCNKTYYWDLGSNTNTDGGYDVPYHAGFEPLVVWSPIDKDGYDGFIVCGGYDDCVADADVKTCYFRRIDPFHSTRWVALADMPFPMSYMGFVVGGDPYGDGLTYGDPDTVYAFGGGNATADSNNNCWKYNVTADTWAACANMPRARGDMWCEWINTTYTACYSGWFSHPANAAGARYTEIYDTVGDSWTEVDMGGGYPNEAYGCAGYRFDGEIFRAGCAYSASYKYDVYQLDAEFDDWIQISEDWVSGDQGLAHGSCDEYYGRAICEGVGGIGWMWHAFYAMPKEPFLQVGNYINSTYTESIDMVEEVNISNFVNEVNEFVNDCTADSEGYCTLPLYFYNGAGGNMTVHSLNITTSLDNLDLNWSTVTCAGDYCDKALRICSDQNGTVEVSNINITYEGTKFINITAFNSTSSDTHWINVYHSKFSRALPYAWTDAIFFLPQSSNESNVTAYGQTSSVPLINLTGQAQDKNFTVALQWNNSLACVNLTFSNSSSKSNGFVVSNSSFTQICSVENTGTCSMWAWADLNSCNASATRYIQPTMEWKSCCVDCVSCGW